MIKLYIYVQNKTFLTYDECGSWDKTVKNVVLHLVCCNLRLTLKKNKKHFLVSLFSE